MVTMIQTVFMQVDESVSEDCSALDDHATAGSNECEKTTDKQSVPKG